MTNLNGSSISFNPEELKNEYLIPARVWSIPLDVNLSHLSEGDLNSLPKLIKAIQKMDEPFMLQDHPQSTDIKRILLEDVRNGSEAAKIALEVFKIFNGVEGINYKTNEVVPLFSGVLPRPKGGTLYPDGATPEKIEAYLNINPEKRDAFEKRNVIIKETPSGFDAIPYETVYRHHLEEAANLLTSAASDVSDQKFAEFLRLRADALLSGDYRESDTAWVQSNDSQIDMIIGWIESYRDQLLSKRAFYRGVLCVKDPEGSKIASGYIESLPELEKALPQDSSFAKDMSKIKTNVAMVNVLYMTGDAQAKRTGILVAQSLPNDEEITKNVGRKVFIYKNILGAFKSDQRVLDALIDPALHPYHTTRGEMNYVLGHELGHELGPIETRLISNEKPINTETALGFWYHILSEAKCDLAAIYNIPHLLDKEVYTEKDEKEIITEAALMRLLPFNKPLLENPYSSGDLMKFNYFLHPFNKGIVLEDGKFALNEKNIYRATKNMMGDLLSLLSAKDQKDAAACQKSAENYVKTWTMWPEEAQQTSEILQKIEVPLYKVVRQPIAEKILSNN